jgi:hypothetical protein
LGLGYTLGLPVCNFRCGRCVEGKEKRPPASTFFKKKITYIILYIIIVKYILNILPK